MLDYGCETKWSPQACQKKWRELYPNDGNTNYNSSINSTPITTFSPEYLNPVTSNNDYASWNETTNAQARDRKGSCSSLGEEEEEDSRVRRAMTPRQNMPIRHRSSVGGSRNGSVARGSRSIYEQKQNWTVRPQ
jgi:hypothetical protein